MQLTISGKSGKASKMTISNKAARKLLASMGEEFTDFQWGLFLDLLAEVGSISLW